MHTLHGTSWAPASVPRQAMGESPCHHIHVPPQTGLRPTKTSPWRITDNTWTAEKLHQQHGYWIPPSQQEASQGSIGLDLPCSQGI